MNVSSSGPYIVAYISLGLTESRRLYISAHTRFDHKRYLLIMCRISIFFTNGEPPQYRKLKLIGTNLKMDSTVRVNTAVSTIEIALIFNRNLDIRH